MFDTPKEETLFWQESNGSEDFKLTRLARKFRSMAMTNLNANISIVGYASGKSLTGNDVDTVINRMVEWAVDVRDRLTNFGVWENAIVGVIMVQPAPIGDDILVLTMRDTKPVVLLPGMRVLPRSEIGHSPGKDDSPIKSSVVVDPFTDGGTLATEVEITLWDDKGIGKKLPETKVTLNVGPNSIKEIGAELTLAKQELKKRMLWGVITKVEVSIKFEGKGEFEQDKTKGLIVKWGGALKSSLEFDLNLAQGVAIHGELELGVDMAGKPAPGVKFGIDF